MAEKERDIKKDEAERKRRIGDLEEDVCKTNQRVTMCCLIDLSGSSVCVCETRSNTHSKETLKSVRRRREDREKKRKKCMCVNETDRKESSGLLCAQHNRGGLTSHTPV